MTVLSVSEVFTTIVKLFNVISPPKARKTEDYNLSRKACRKLEEWESCTGHESYASQTKRLKSVLIRSPKSVPIRNLKSVLTKRTKLVPIKSLKLILIRNPMRPIAEQLRLSVTKLTSSILSVVVLQEHYHCGQQ